METNVIICGVNLDVIIVALMTVIGIVLSLSSVPQILRLFKRKTSGDISLATCYTCLGGWLCWFIYGVYLNNIPLIVSNGVALVLLVIEMILIYKYRTLNPST